MNANPVLLMFTVAPLGIWAMILTQLVRARPFEYQRLSKGRLLDGACVVTMSVLTAGAISHGQVGLGFAVIYAFTALEAITCASLRTYYRHGTS